ncbi:Hypothetical protein BJL86_0076 [Dietzia timorensis]|uniref:Uncharacterized protein n=2 Tax=Dietzia timorensis TaxID=499555 RepID=A0A173LHW8_9ACTN|nr:Hypothetical protein BJL86_0076 [Dietzia timorensis]
MFRHKERLRDTVPGVEFLSRVLGEGMATLDLETACEYAIRAVASFLYGPASLDEIREESEHIGDDVEDAVRARLAELDRATVESGFAHGGDPSPFRSPEFPMLSRERPQYHPRTAFWTATILSGEEDTWTICGENLHPDRPRTIVDFDRRRARMYRVDTLRQWRQVTTEWPVIDGECHWASVARKFDAIALSISGLLLAHPGTIWDTEQPPATAIEQLRTQSLELGVGAWSTVSAAWLNQPPGMTLNPPAT